MKHILPFEESIRTKGAIYIWCSKVFHIEFSDIVLFETLFPSSFQRILASIPLIKRAMKRNYYQKVKTFFEHDLLWVHNDIKLVSFLNKADVVLHLHNFYLSQVTTHVDILNQIKHIYVPSMVLKNCLVNLGVRRNKVSVIKNGVDDFNADDEWYCRNVDFTFCGRFDENKGFKKVYELLINNNIEPCVRVEIIVAKTPILQLSFLMNLVRLFRLRFKFGKMLKVHTHADHNFVLEVFARTKYLLVPTITNEAFGMVALEGLSEGAVVADSGVGGLSEVVPYSSSFMSAGNYNIDRFDFILKEHFKISNYPMDSFTWQAISSHYLKICESL